MTSLHRPQKFANVSRPQIIPIAFGQRSGRDMVSMEHIETCPQMDYSFLLSRMDFTVLA